RAAHKLLGEPAPATRHRREYDKTDDLAGALGDEDAAPFQPAQRFRLDQKVQRWQAARLQPLAQATAQRGMRMRLLRRPFAHRHALIARAIKLRAQRSA